MTVLHEYTYHGDVDFLIFLIVMVGIVLIAFMLAKGVHRRRYMLESFGKIRARELRLSRI